MTDESRRKMKADEVLHSTDERLAAPMDCLTISQAEELGRLCGLVEYLGVLCEFYSEGGEGVEQ